MSTSLRSRFRKIERRLRKRFGRDISTPKGRRRAWLHFQLLDHAFLRIFWWNLDEIAPQVWRSNQPSQRRLKRYKKMGIRAIINLRGETRNSPYLFEKEACDALGITLHDITFSARKLVGKKTIFELLDLMRTTEKPFVMHCKSGADRAGFASVLYMAIIEGQPIEQARKHLHWRYAHLSSTDTGILDHVFDVYEADNARSPIGLEDWFATTYNAKALTKSWEASRS